MKKITATNNELVNHNYDISFSVIMKDIITTPLFSASGCINWKATFLETVNMTHSLAMFTYFHPEIWFLNIYSNVYSLEKTEINRIRV